MAKELMNEAERYLLQNWADARLLEEAMEGVRTKYKVLFQKIIETVTKGHPELDTNVLYLTQSWTNGQIAFGKREWPVNAFGSPAGLWLEKLRLKVLAGEDSEPPEAYIWAPKKSDLNFDAARTAVKAEANRILNAEMRELAVTPISGETLLVLPAPSKQQFMDALLDGDGQEFVQLFLAQFDMMAKFVPVLDKVFRECVIKDE